MSRTLMRCAATLLIRPPASSASKMTQETFGVGDRTRTYCLLVPAVAKKARPI